jgi:hypothetical protein
MRIPTVIGGIYASMMSEETQRYVDTVVTRENKIIKIRPKKDSFLGRILMMENI